MDQRDYDLLHQLLAATPTELAAWYNQASNEELIHANHVMDLYAHYLKQELVFTEIDEEIANMTTLTQAQAVIAAVRP